MGNQQSVNDTTQDFKMMSEVTNKTSQNCAASQTQSVDITITNANNSTFNLGPITQTASSMTTCSQKSDNQAKISQDMAATVKSMADNARAMFSANPGSSEARNTTRQYLSASALVQNNALQNCIPSSVQQVAYNFTNINSSVVNAQPIDQVSSTIVQCTQDASTSSEVAQKMSAVIDVTAKNTQETLTGILYMIILMIGVCVVAFVVVGGLGGGQVLDKVLDWKTILAFSLVLGVIFGGYLLFANQQTEAAKANSRTLAASQNEEWLKKANADKAILKTIIDDVALKTGVSASTQTKACATYYDPKKGYYWNQASANINRTSADTTRNSTPSRPNLFTSVLQSSTATTLVNDPTKDDAPFVPLVPMPLTGVANQIVRPRDRTGYTENYDVNNAEDVRYGWISSRKIGWKPSLVRLYAEEYGVMYSDFETDQSILTRADPTPDNLKASVTKPYPQLNLMEFLTELIKVADGTTAIDLWKS